jgi:cytosine permease
LASSSFGETGSRVVISFVLGIATLGWFGVQANLCGVAFSNILASWLGINLPVWISSLIWGVIMLTTAIYGFNALKYLNYIAVPSLIILSLYGTFISLSTYGSDILFSYQPPQPFPFIQGVALAVGTFAVGGVIAGDYSRYAVGRKDAILSSVLGVLPAGVGMLVMGGVMAVVAGTYDITVILANLGVPLIGLIVLILATWTTNTVNAYSGGLAITNMFNLGDSNRALATGIAGALGTLLAIAGIIDYFINYLLVLTSAIPAVAGVMIADYWIVKKGDASKWNKVPGVNWVGIISWLLGVVAGNVIKVGVGPLSGIVVSLVAYIILHSFVAKEEQSK